MRSFASTAAARFVCRSCAWVHRFDRPGDIPYNNVWEDRVRNYVIGFRELGLPTAGVDEAHFGESHGVESADKNPPRIERELTRN